MPSRLSWRVGLGFSLVALAGSPAAAISLGQVDAFQSGTLGWEGGSTASTTSGRSRSPRRVCSSRSVSQRSPADGESLAAPLRLALAQLRVRGALVLHRLGHVEDRARVQRALRDRERVGIARDRSSAAISRAVASSASPGTTRFTSPIASASGASITRAVSTSSCARPRPTMRGKQVRAAEPGQDAELRERSAELGALGGDPDVARQDHRHADADRGAVHRRDHGLRDTRAARAGSCARTPPRRASGPCPRSARPASPSARRGRRPRRSPGPRRSGSPRARRRRRARRGTPPRRPRPSAGRRRCASRAGSA